MEPLATYNLSDLQAVVRRYKHFGSEQPRVLSSLWNQAAGGLQADLDDLPILIDVMHPDTKKDLLVGESSFAGQHKCVWDTRITSMLVPVGKLVGTLCIVVHLRPERGYSSFESLDVDVSMVF